jgi:Tol biopolymer transport system component
MSARPTTRRLSIAALTAVAATVLVLGALTATPAGAKPARANGQIAFARFDAALGDTIAYRINPDGTHEQQVPTPQVSAELPRWSPDGTRLALLCCDSVAYLLNPDTSASVSLPNMDPDLFYGCNTWSPDGSHLACEAGFIDPSRQGIYTIRSSDGGNLTQVTSNPGGDDIPDSFSPSGKRIAFTRQSPDGSETLDTVKLGGTGLRQLTPTAMDIEFGTGAWSPQGNEILFSARAAEGHYRTLWIVHSDGGGLRRLAIGGCGGAFSDPNGRSCLDPTWSPDGQKIAFSLFDAATGERDIYTVNTDGTGLFQVTHGDSVVLGEGDEAPSWGRHPFAR